MTEVRPVVVVDMKIVKEGNETGMSVGGAGVEVGVEVGGVADLGATHLEILAPMNYQVMMPNRLDLVCREGRELLTAKQEDKVLVPMLPFLPRRGTRRRQPRDAITAEGIDRDEPYRLKRGRKLYGRCK